MKELGHLHGSTEAQKVIRASNHLVWLYVFAYFSSLSK